MNSPVYKLIDWVSINDINWSGMSLNEHGEDLLRNNLKLLNYFNIGFRNDYLSFELLTSKKTQILKVQLFYLSKNPYALNYLMKNEDLINWYYLSYNTNSKILFLLRNDKYKNKINWDNLSSNTNPEILEFLFEHPDKINYCRLSGNNTNKALEYLKEHQDKIDWIQLSKNVNDGAIELLKNNQNKINWYYFSMNNNDNAFELFIDNIDLVNWYSIVYNTNTKALKLLMKYKYKITNWSGLCLNDNDIAIDLILKNYNRIDFLNLCDNKNPRILEILKNNIDKISWYTFSSNPLIFKLEYNKMSDNFSNLKEDIIKEVMHPKRVFKDPNYDYIEELFGD
jgi:hypothetical protein